VASATDLYRQHHIDKGDERLGLFRGLVERYGVESALYPGSFVHVTPSFVVPTVVYADSDKRAARFFADPEVRTLVLRFREYEQEPVFRFHSGDFATAIDEPDASFDLLISQYAGFVSRACKRYVTRGGHLVVNNSHGDASMAALDPDWRLVAAYRRRGERYTFSEADLQTYMVPKRGEPPTEAELESRMRGPAFTRSAAGYVFERTR
jgi:hypothetical protein